MPEFYTDALLGNWKLNKKTKTELHYTRSTNVKLHKDYAMDYTDPKTFKNYKIWGDVVLGEKKILVIETSNFSTFRTIDTTPTTEKQEIL